MENNSSESSECCKNCQKNMNLIKKYEKLTHLYEKKQLKMSMNGSSCISNGKSTNNTIEHQSSDIPCIKMFDILNKLLKNRYMSLFRVPLPKSAKKLVLLNIVNRMTKFYQAKGFIRIKSYGKQCEDCTGQIHEQKIQKLLHSSVNATDINSKSGNSVNKQQIICTEIKNEQNLKMIKQQISKLKNISISSFNGNKWLQRKNMELQIINNKLVSENKFLKQSIQEIEKRLVRQNQKKKETLQELAQEMSQKNQEINALKQTIRAYEETNELNGNVLQSDMISMKKQIDHLQHINQRLNNDLQKIKNQLLQANKKIKVSDQKYKELDDQCLKLKKSNYQMNLKMNITQKSFNEYSKLMKSIEKKIKRLNVYEKQLQTNNQLNLDNPANKAIQQIKSQIILMYLANISDESYQLYSSHLFDQQEKLMLKQHKNEWNQKCYKIKQTNKVEKQNYDNNKQLDCLQISEIEMKGTGMDSVMNALEFTRQHIQEPRTNQGVAMKMLQMEIDKNKQVSKISEIKEKLLHIRVIILKLLKSLEISSQIKIETRDILRVLFQLFEYSEQERQSIFMKKKKFFGFI